MSTSLSRSTMVLGFVWIVLAGLVGVGIARGVSLQGAFSLPVLLLLMSTALLGSRIYAHVAHPAPTTGDA